MNIPGFRKKWRFFTGKDRALKISPTYFPDKASTSARKFAEKFPVLATAPIPTADADASSIGRGAVEYWLTSNILPPDREYDFARMTGVPLAIWASEQEAFEANVRRAAGEWLSWDRLIRGAVPGDMMVKVENADPTTRFVVEDLAPDGPGLVKCWPGCRAWVELPPIAAAGAKDWRAWLIADYTPQIFVLDPRQRGDGGPTPTRLLTSTRKLPRGWNLGIPSEFEVDQTFDTVVLAFNLEDQAAPVVEALDQLERKLTVPDKEAFERSTHVQIRQTLDEVATLLDSHAVDRRVYRQPCIIGRKPQR